MAYYSETLALNARNQEYVVHNHLAKEHKTHIILVDEHVLIRSALHRMLTTIPSLHVIADCSTIEDMFAKIDDTVTIVLGPSIAIAECLQMIERLRQQHPACGVVLIQQNLYPETARLLITQGVYGLLDKHASEKDLAFAITAASSTHVFLNRDACDELATALSRTAGHLTGREMQVLSHLKYGESNFRIAHKLGLKEKTIEKYLTNIYDKLNVHSRTEALLCLQQLHI